MITYVRIHIPKVKVGKLDYKYKISVLPKFERVGKYASTFKIRKLVSKMLKKVF